VGLPLPLFLLSDNDPTLSCAVRLVYSTSYEPLSGNSIIGKVEAVVNLSIVGFVGLVLQWVGGFKPNSRYSAL